MQPCADEDVIGRSQINILFIILMAYLAVESTFSLTETRACFGRATTSKRGI